MWRTVWMICCMMVFCFLLCFYLKSFSPFFKMWQRESSWSNYWEGGNPFFPVFLEGFGAIFKQMIEPCRRVYIYINNHMLLLLIDGVSEHFNNQKQFHVFTCSSHPWHVGGGGGVGGVKRPVTLLFSVFPFDSIHPVRDVALPAFCFFPVEIKMKRSQMWLESNVCGLRPPNMVSIVVSHQHFWKAFVFDPLSRPDFFQSPCL